MKMTKNLFVLLLVTFLRADLNHQWEYLDNGKIRIGVDKSRGACIGFFGESITKKNLLNNFDEGRFIQQSYYGDKDGSKWNGKPWRYNPVQGGDWKGNKSRILNFSKINGAYSRQWVMRDTSLDDFRKILTYDSTIV